MSAVAETSHHLQPLISDLGLILMTAGITINEVAVLMGERKYRGPIIMMFLFRVMLSLFFLGFLLNRFFSPSIAFVTLVIAVAVYVIFPKRLNKLYHKLNCVS